MKYAFIAVAVAVLSFGANAMAEDGNVSKSQLSELGIPGLNVMSDTQGSEIRGQGFAFASSISASALPGSFTFNPAVALGSNSAAAATGAQSNLQAGGIIGGIGPGGGFLGFFNLKVSVGSSGYAFAASN